jgi:peptide/nickel transport system substrate-binding protein
MPCFKKHKLELPRGPACGKRAVFIGRALIAGLVLQVGVALPSRAELKPPVTLHVGLATASVTFDPHSMNVGSTTLVNRSVFEALVGRGQHMEIVPQLATSWSRVDARRWRFVIRRGVRFHDGDILTVDDVIYSLHRAASDRSDFQIYTDSIEAVERLDASTVDIVTKAPDEILVDKLTRVFIVSRKWEEKHGWADPIRPGSSRAAYVDQANGTGRYRLVSGSPAEGRIEMARFDRWWGGNAGEPAGNVDQIIYQPIPIAAARAAALMSGDADLIIDAPPPLISSLKARASFKIVTSPENRTIMIGFDQRRARLQYSDASINPFKDRRVRQAVSLAIDSNAIRTGLMDGFSLPAGSLIAPSIFGYSAKTDAPIPTDLGAARELMKAAGYEQGFSVTLDCPAHRYVNDESICAAVAGMLSKIGIRVNVNVMPLAMWYAKILRRDTSLFLIGWASPTFDGEFSLSALLHTPSTSGGPNGAANGGWYSNPAIDDLIDGLSNARSLNMRAAMIDKALELAKTDVAYVPIHHQVLVWAMKTNVDAVITPEGQLDVNWVTVH